MIHFVWREKKKKTLKLQFPVSAVKDISGSFSDLFCWIPVNSLEKCWLTFQDRNPAVPSL